MQSFTILQNPYFTSTTIQASITDPTLVLLSGGIWVHKLITGNGLTTAQNVNAYLSNTSNIQISNDFISYLSGNTTPVQFASIFNDASLLSKNFNYFYETYTLGGSQVLNTTEISSTTSASTLVNAVNIVHDWQEAKAQSNFLSGTPVSIIAGNSRIINYSYLSSEPESNQNYYIPVFITTSQNDTPWDFKPCQPQISETTAFMFPQYSSITQNYFSSINNNFNVSSSANTQPNLTFNNLVSTSLGSAPFSIDSQMSNPVLSNLNNALPLSSATVNTDMAISSGYTQHLLVQCFVDLNLQTNENLDWSYNPLAISFGSPTYSDTEGSTFSIPVSLNMPSTLGIEEATIILYQTGSTSNNLPVFSAFTSFPDFPVTLTFSATQQTQNLTFVGNPSFFETSNIQSFQLGITNTINLTNGSFVNANVDIMKIDALRTVSIGSIGISESIVNGVPEIILKQGSSSTITIQLDGPAYGFEQITLLATGNASNSITSTTVTTLSQPGIDYTSSPVLPITVKFVQGETKKTIDLSSLVDNSIGDSQIILQLTNANNVLVDSVYNILLVSMPSINPVSNYVTLNFGTIYNQYASVASTPTYFKSVSTPFYTSGQYVYTKSSLIEFDSVGASDSNKRLHAFSGNELVLSVVNSGAYSIKYNGQNVIPGASFSVLTTTDPFIITLPTNNSLNVNTNQLLDAVYTFSIQTKYADNLFSPKSELNNTSSAAVNNTVNLGMFVLSGYESNQSILSANTYYLYTRYSNAGTGRATTHNMTCPSALYPYDTTAKENIEIQGFAFIDFKSSTNFKPFATNNAYTNNAFSFMKPATANFIVTCGPYLNEPTGNSFGMFPEWYTTLPFVVI